MRTLTFSDTRAHFAETLNKVVDDREPVTVTRANREAVVIMALDDYESMQETLYLLRSPANARRLFAAIDRMERGTGAAVEIQLDELIDPDQAP
ncbi:type II toxin-antitoxin system prevent-host-death family antitoxin [Catenulispora sp. NF23]|uniref:Antitoxin n=1 Tax=Catenulispora pinistramenti TaxID=2705254 RepID=A0ABS5KUM8_9ACTN|nr:type II toxin-antitoxin system prevent-host-death family antitoxin [Catenulispora pinistramenti]MBS2537213.1 type II toxin-antitoxin system prevent-host-death family antitoxin [Catenulispora pinistramenti]MBS2549715.1 type II toxin-antitoxin system prevent-host-death family antitoxin [Catenulispora pinistramenti]